MKRVKLDAARGSLAEYAAGLGDEILLVTKGRRPVAAIVPLRNVAWEAIALSHHPDFDALLRAMPNEDTNPKRPVKKPMRLLR